jgi:hypothetical protein
MVGVSVVIGVAVIVRCAVVLGTDVIAGCAEMLGAGDVDGACELSGTSGPVTFPGDISMLRAVLGEVGAGKTVGGPLLGC